jgi:1-acyl-sn-glycerol-3-phosphate acyltransferase
MNDINGGNYVYRLCSYWSDVWFFFTGIQPHKINAQLFDKNKKYIIVANHISYLDIPVLLKIFRKPLRPLGKSEMLKIPIIGFLYEKIVVTVDRSSNESRAISIKKLISVMSKGISSLVFPEGTFNMTNQPLKDFYNGAFKIAIETQTPIKPVLFLDTFDRLHYASLFSLNPGKCRVVFLPDIEVEGFTLKDLNFLKQKTFCAMEQALIEYKASWAHAKK